MEDAGQRYGVDVQWLSSPTFSIEDMADFLDDAIASGVDGLGVTCPDRTRSGKTSSAPAPLAFP
jgi:ABC-type sugar transport system substrate-binding protein